MQALKIGDLAKRAEVSVDTIRFYERRGVLPAPSRRPSGYRAYPAEMIGRIRMVKFLQILGFTLNEIVLTLKDIDSGILDRDAGEVRLANVRNRIDARIADLQAVKANIDQVIAECRAGHCRMAEYVPDIECSSSRPGKKPKQAVGRSATR